MGFAVAFRLPPVLRRPPSEPDHYTTISRKCEPPRCSVVSRRSAFDGSFRDLARDGFSKRGVYSRLVARFEPGENVGARWRRHPADELSFALPGVPSETRTPKTRCLPRAADKLAAKSSGPDKVFTLDLLTRLANLCILARNAWKVQ